MTTPHLDDEAMSAAFDGEATGTEEAHLSTCESCRERLDSLRAVAAMVAAAVVPPPRAVVDRGINRALDEWPALTASPPGPPPRPERTLPSSLKSAASFASSRPAPGRRPRPPAWLVPVIGIAATFLIFGLIVSSLSTSSSKSTATATLTTTTATAAAAAAPASRGASSTVVTGPAPVVRVDLGDQSDAAVVARLVHAELRVGSGGGNLDPATAQQSVAAARCLIEARSAVGVASGDNTAPRYSAVLRFRGQAAVVVVFAPPGGDAGVILKTADCSVLAVLPL